MQYIHSPSTSSGAANGAEGDEISSFSLTLRAIFIPK